MSTPLPPPVLAEAKKNPLSRVLNIITIVLLGLGVLFSISGYFAGGGLSTISYKHLLFIKSTDEPGPFISTWGLSLLLLVAGCVYCLKFVKKCREKGLDIQATEVWDLCLETLKPTQ